MVLWRRIARSFALAMVVTALLTRCGTDDPLAQLRAGRRPVEARLTSFDYAPLRVSQGNEHSLRATEMLLIGRLKTPVEKERAPNDLHRLALGQLAVGETEAARALLEEAARLQPNDATILSDLASAEMALGQIFDAAEHSAQALERDPKNEAAAFNWALALDKLYNRPVAIEAWQKFLELDVTSSWSDEARQHLARLREPQPDWERDKKLIHAGTDAATLRHIHEQFPQRVRLLIHRELLPKWTERGGADDLTVMRTLAEARANGGDPFILDVVEHAAAHRSSVADAMRTYAAAVDAEAKLQFTAAAEHYAAAAELLRQAGSPLVISADISAAANDSYQARNDAALARLDRVDAQLAATGNRYPGIAAQSSWIRGLVLMKSGNPQACLDAYRRGRAEANRAGEIESALAIEQLMATQIENVGSREEADQARLDVLRRCDEVNPELRRLYTAISETAGCQWLARRPRLALAFNEWQTHLAQLVNEPLFLADCASWRAVSLLDIGRVNEAAAAVRIGRAAAMRAAPSGLHEAALADLAFTAGRIQRLSGNLGRAIAELSDAIAIWETNRWHMHVASAYLARGETALAAGDRAAAERDFRAGVAEAEAQREHSEQAMRVAYFERADPLFEHLIELLVDSGRTDEALSFVERKRARFLLDQIAQKPEEKPLDAKAIASASRGRAPILELALLERGTSMWLIRDGRVTYAKSNAGRAEIEAAVRRQLAAIDANDTATIQSLGRWLFDELVAPAVRQLPPDSDLVIVPDGALQGLSFATLVMPDGRYLIEGYTLATAPSATMFLHAAPAAPASRPIIAVAQPAPSGFATLPNAAYDVRRIARLYGGQQARIGREITPAEFLAEAAKSAYVHFDGHATVDLRHPSKSALQFETGDAQPATLSAETIAATRLPTRPLIILAACSTGRGKVLRNEGIDSLASAFLQARARGVVATLWDVKDAPTGELFRVLHMELHRGRRPADALREAQRSFIHSSDPKACRPDAWGSTVVIGTL